MQWNFAMIDGRSTFRTNHGNRLFMLTYNFFFGCDSSHDDAIKLNYRCFDWLQLFQSSFRCHLGSIFYWCLCVNVWFGCFDGSKSFSYDRANPWSRTEYRSTWSLVSTEEHLHNGTPRHPLAVKLSVGEPISTGIAYLETFMIGETNIFTGYPIPKGGSPHTVDWLPVYHKSTPKPVPNDHTATVPPLYTKTIILPLLPPYHHYTTTAILPTRYVT